MGKSYDEFKKGHAVRLQVFCDIDMDAVEEAVSSYNESADDGDTLKLDDWFFSELRGELDEDLLIDFIRENGLDDHNLDPVEVVTHALEKLY